MICVKSSNILEIHGRGEEDLRKNLIFNHYYDTNYKGSKGKNMSSHFLHMVFINFA